MSDVAVFVNVSVVASEASQLKDYRSRNVRTLHELPGFKSMTIWKSESAASEYLMLLVYADEGSADEGLRLSTEAGLLVESLKRPTPPPTVRRGSIRHRDGRSPKDSPVGSMASVSVRVADPGRGDELEAELVRIFGELHEISGYRGSLVVRNENLPEEAVAIVFWDTRKAFEKSLPSKQFYEVELFERVL